MAILSYCAILVASPGFKVGQAHVGHITGLHVPLAKGLARSCALILTFCPQLCLYVVVNRNKQSNLLCSNNRKQTTSNNQRNQQTICIT